jgi:hypothetical protein
MTRLYFWGEVDKGQSGLWNIFVGHILFGYFCGEPRLSE